MGGREAEGGRVLTPRQHEVLALVNRGHTNKYIAKQLDISRNTVIEHVYAVCKRLGASTRTEACYLARQEGLLK